MALLIGNTIPFIFVGAILTTFYCLDSLYAERKSKSILFWRSLPITDAETVVSKFLTAAIAIPLFAFAVIVIVHLVILLMTSIFVSIEGGSSMLLIWKSAPLFDAWAAILIIMLLLPVWFSPFIGWFLFVSAWTKRSPLLMAFLPLVLLPTLEYWVLRTHLIFDAIKTRFEHLPIFKGIDPSSSSMKSVSLPKLTQSACLASSISVNSWQAHRCGRASSLPVCSSRRRSTSGAIATIPSFETVGPRCRVSSIFLETGGS